MNECDLFFINISFLINIHFVITETLKKPLRIIPAPDQAEDKLRGINSRRAALVVAKVVNMESRKNTRGV